MVGGLEALFALAEFGTMTRAATRLRITQSAVSKRIAALERDVGSRLVERDGRRVRFTPAGLDLIERTRPLLGELRTAISVPSGNREAVPIVVGVSESILASWGARVLARCEKALAARSGSRLILNAHRSPVAIDGVRSGEYALAIVAGLNDQAEDLTEESIFEEEMVIVPNRLRKFTWPRQGSVPVCTIEPSSSTWRAVRPRLSRLQRELASSVEIVRTLQSFACIVQMARSGFGHGLVPLGIARSMGVPDASLVRFPRAGLSRPISVVGRPMTWARGQTSDLLELLRKVGETEAWIRS